MQQDVSIQSALLWGKKKVIVTWMLPPWAFKGSYQRNNSRVKLKRSEK